MVSPEPFTISELLDLREALSLQVAKDEGKLFKDHSFISFLMFQPGKCDLWPVEKWRKIFMGVPELPWL